MPPPAAFDKHFNIDYGHKPNKDNIWDSNQQYLEYLNKTAASSNYWKQLDIRINDALAGKHDYVSFKDNANADSNNKNGSVQNVNKQNEHNVTNKQNHGAENTHNVSYEKTSNTSNSANIAINHNNHEGTTHKDDTLKVHGKDLVVNNKSEEIHLLDKINANKDQENLHDDNKDINKHSDSKVEHNTSKDKHVDMVDSKAANVAKLNSSEANNSKNNKESTVNGSEVNHKDNTNGEFSHNNEGSGRHSEGKEFNLHAVLEAAKAGTNGFNHNHNSNIMDDFGLSNISVEALENTYKQDEANSMSYALDSNHAYTSGDHSTSTSHEQHKIKAIH